MIYETGYLSSFLSSFLLHFCLVFVGIINTFALDLSLFLLSKSDIIYTLLSSFISSKGHTKKDTVIFLSPTEDAGYLWKRNPDKCICPTPNVQSA